jgi:hypothetical protein
VIMPQLRIAATAVKDPSPKPMPVARLTPLAESQLPGVSRLQPAQPRALTKKSDLPGPPSKPVPVAQLTPLANSELPGVSQLQPAPRQPLTKKATRQGERRVAAMIGWGMLGMLLLVLFLASSGVTGVMAGLVFAAYPGWRFFRAWRGCETVEIPATEID